MKITQIQLCAKYMSQQSLNKGNTHLEVRVPINFQDQKRSQPQGDKKLIS